MKSITIRDLRQRWPIAESLLQSEHELVVTRDGRPIARLVRLETEIVKRRRFNPAKHRAWQQRVFGEATTLSWVDKNMAVERRLRAI